MAQLNEIQRAKQELREILGITDGMLTSVEATPPPKEAEMPQDPTLP